MHKYLYTHGDPVNGIDPTGMFALASFSAGFSISSSIQNVKIGVDLAAFDAADMSARGLSVQQTTALFLAFNLAGVVAGPLLDLGASVGGRALSKISSFVADTAQPLIALVRSGKKSVLLSELDSLRRPGPARAIITRDMIGTGTSASQSIRPPGFLGGARGHARGHLIGAQLGGSGSDKRNLITMFQNPANSPVMRGFENQVRRAVEAGEIIDYIAIPVYRGSELGSSRK